MPRAREPRPEFDPQQLIVRPATAARWKDVETLFGERGACGGCWCMVWRRPRKEYEAGKGAGNKRAFKRLVTGGDEPGVIGYIGRKPVAWCAVAPREQYDALARSRVLSPVDDQPVWSISCLFVLRAYRRRGLSVRMLAAAAEFAASRGARIVEGYPVVPAKSDAPGVFLWTGVPEAFRKAGFRQVARRSPVRPIMRRVVS